LILDIYEVAFKSPSIEIINIGALNRPVSAFNPDDAERLPPGFEDVSVESHPCKNRKDGAPASRNEIVAA